MGRVEDIPNHVCDTQNGETRWRCRCVTGVALVARSKAHAEIAGCAAHRVVIACGLAASAARTVLGEVGGRCRDVASRISRKPGAGWLNVASLFAAALYPQPTSLSTKAFPCASGR